MLCCLSWTCLAVLVWFSPGYLNDSTSKALKIIKPGSDYHWVSVRHWERNSVKLLVNLHETKHEAYVFLCVHVSKQRKSGMKLRSQYSGYSLISGEL